MQTQKVIEQLGYTPKEAKVYLVALRLRECTVSDIASAVGLPVSSTQSIVDALRKDGLLNFYIRRRYKYWIAERPEKLIEKLKHREELLNAAMPRLEKLRKASPSEHGPSPETTLYEGIDEIQQVLDDVIETKTNVSAVIPHDDFMSLFADTSYLEDFTEARVSRFLRLRMLTNDSQTTRALIQGPPNLLREVRIMPDDIELKFAVLLYGEKVAFILINEQKPMAILIKDSNVFKTFESFFESMWARAGVADERPRANLYLQILTGGSTQPMLVTDGDVNIVHANAAWEQHTGYSLEEIEGKNPTFMRSGKTPSAVYTRMWDALTSGKQFQTEEIIDKKKDGSFFNLRTTIFPIKVQGAQFYIQILDDITDEVQTHGTRQDVFKGAVANIAARIHRLAYIPKLLANSGQQKLARVVKEDIAKLNTLVQDLDPYSDVTRPQALVEEAEKILQTSIAATKADFGTVQVLNAASGKLEIVAQQKLPQYWLDYWHTVKEKKGSCGNALSVGKRVIVEDIEKSKVFTGDTLAMQRKVGIRAVQSTPITNRAGKTIGMFSTHYKQPHHFSKEELRSLDLLAEYAVVVVERRQLETAVRE